MIMTKNTPSLGEVRRHWGLAVDIHRREERLEEFDRMIKSHVKSVVEDVLKQEVSTLDTASGDVYILSEDVDKLMKEVVENV